MKYKRITLLCGHYGSGKTNVAVNMAMDLRKQEKRVAIADLDIVNPYYRSADSREELEAAGVRVIVSEYANTNLDAPALPQEIYSITDDKTQHVIIDVGGDERGALALGRIAPAIRDEDDYEMYLVVNRFRPLTRTPEEILGVMKEIEDACGIKFTGIIHNSNLGAETDAELVRGSQKFAQETAQMTGLPVVLTTVEDTLYEALKNDISDLFPLHLQKRPV